MALWLVARIIHQKHAYAAHHVKRVGFQSFYPMWQRTYARPTRVEEGALYPGYMFVLSPTRWYSILECCSAVVGIAANSAMEPLRSLALDAHVEMLMAQTRDGFVRPPKKVSTCRFLRGQRVYVQNAFFTGDATFLKIRADGGAEIEAIGGALPMIVREHEVLAA